MKYSLTDGALADYRTPCLVTSLKKARGIARSLGELSQFNRAAMDFEDKAEQSLIVNLPGSIPRLVVVGNADAAATPASFTKLAAYVASTLVKLPIKQAILALDHIRVSERDKQWRTLCLMQAISHAAYSYTRHKSSPPPPTTLTSTRIHVTKRAGMTQTVRLGNALDQGLALTRDLGNEPPNVCTPNYLLRESRKLGKAPKVKVTNLDERKMDSLKMGAFLAVSKGSDVPGQMIIIQYNGTKKSTPPIALVGKGITFDTGGISLKPSPAMDEMKFDMCGAAAVLGATKAAIAAELPINLVTIVAAAENMPSGRATRPGDIVTSAAGKTIEILNTDAEGRLVLCDAITHAQTFKPKAIIDAATLTGACIVALGSHASALYANDDKLAQALLDAGTNTGDRAWRMPLWDDYQSALKSNFADVANIGGREAGSVTAACFLARFVDDVPWAHLDIAGSAFQGGPRKGATGRPVPLLFNYLCQQAGLSK